MAEKIQFHVFFLDVGQGNSTLIVKRAIPDKGETKCYSLLVDTDTAGMVNAVNLVKDAIPIIKKDAKDVHFVDAMVITHPHDDHIGGLDAFVNDKDILVSKIFHPDYDFISDKDTADYRAYNKLRKDSSSQNETRLIAGTDYGTDTGIPFTTISPPQTIEDSNQFKDQPEKIQVHNQSAAITVDLNGTKFLFLGDANQECVNRLVKYYEDKLSADFLIAAHHGSNSIFVPEAEIEESMKDVKRKGTDTKWNEDFLSKIGAKYVIISCGKYNKYNHPHSAALEAYKDEGRVVKRTDLDSTIYVVLDENGCYSINYLKSYDEVVKKVKSLFPVNAKADDSVKPFFIGTSQIPVPPRNA